ncbi:MAG: DNA primase [Flavobacteriaceae bacterium]|nr:MAG: DNA primase [Flavobacteriaceae bacterium]
MKYLIIILCFFSLSVFAQEQKEAPKSAAPKVEVKKEVNAKLARKFVREGNVLYQQKKYADAEVAYKKAIENNPAYETAKYNLGNALSQQNRNKEAIAQYQLLAKETKDKLLKSQAMHNIGNDYFKEKDYQNSVNAYKNSLRANPKDDETRYNLALAQMLLEDQKNKDKDKDKKDDKQKDKDKQDQDKKDNDDKKDDKNKDDQNKDKKDPKDDKKDQQKKPQPGKLSPQQMQQLLDAMANEEQKTQKKMNAKKEKGKKVKQEKDW